MHRHYLIAFALLLASLVLAAPEDSLRTRVFNVRDYGAVLDGKTDDAPAIMAAFKAMLVDGHPLGTLHIPGVARIASTVDLDGGYRNVTQEQQWSAGKGEVFRVVMDGGFRPDPGIGVAVKLHGARNVYADIYFDKGGRESDIGLQVEDLDFADLSVTGTDFAGTVLYADASADRTRRIRSTKIRRVFVSNCGRAIYWRGIEAFGGFEFVWDRNCKNGSVFKECADTAIQHYENFSPASHEIGLHFENCNMFQVGVITVGDRATDALVQITGGDFGSIFRIRASGRPDRGVAETNPVGLKLVNVKSVSIDNLQTFRCRIGLQAIGSTFSIKQHHSLTGDLVPMQIEGSEQFHSPRVEVGAWYRYHMRESVKVLDSVKGGTVRLQGMIYDMNIENVPNQRYSIDCRSPQAVLDVRGLTIERRGNLLGSIYHPTPANIRGVAQARLAEPLVHGEVAEGQLTPGAVQTNASERTLNLYITVHHQPQPGAGSACVASLGPTAAVIPVAQETHPAGAPASEQTLYLRVPPWWSYKVELSNATLAGVKVVAE